MNYLPTKNLALSSTNHGYQYPERSRRLTPTAIHVAAPLGVAARLVLLGLRHDLVHGCAILRCPRALAARALGGDLRIGYTGRMGVGTSSMETDHYHGRIRTDAELVGVAPTF